MSELSQKQENGPASLSILYSRTRYYDQEALVGATMHMQSEQLKH